MSQVDNFILCRNKIAVSSISELLMRVHENRAFKFIDIHLQKFGAKCFGEEM